MNRLNLTEAKRPFQTKTHRNSKIESREEPVETKYGLMRQQLWEEFRPSSHLQQIAFEAVVVCAIRVQESRAEEAPGVAFDAVSGSAEPYWVDGRARQNAIHLLDRVIEDFQRNGIIRPEWEPQLRQMFGEEVIQEIAAWHPEDAEAVKFAHFLIAMRHRFGFDVEWLDQPGTVASDPTQRKQAILKLLSQERRHLQSIPRMLKAAAAERPRGSNSSPESRALSALAEAIRHYRYIQRCDRVRERAQKGARRERQEKRH